MKKKLTIKNKNQRNIKSRNSKKTKKKIGGGLFGLTKRYFREIYNEYEKKSIIPKLIESIYKEYTNSSTYNEYTINKIHDTLTFGYFIDLTEMKEPRNTKTVFFRNDKPYKISIKYSSQNIIIENKEYSINQLKNYHKFSDYGYLKKYLKTNYSQINNNNNLEFFKQYTVYSYEKINNEYSYYYIGEIKEANINNEHYDNISIILKPDLIGIYRNKPEIEFSEYNIESEQFSSGEQFSSIEIDSYYNIMIIRCNGCSEGDCRCPFRNPETESVREYLGPIGYYSNSLRNMYTSPTYSSLGSVRSEYTNNSIIYDPRTIPSNVEYFVASRSPEKVEYDRGVGNNNSLHGFSLGTLTIQPPTNQQNKKKGPGQKVLDEWKNVGGPFNQSLATK